MGISSALGSSALLPAGLGFRNAIINGDFRINQRAFTSGTTTGVYGFDRWVPLFSGGTVTHSTQAFTLGNAITGQEPTNFARLVTSSQSAASNYAVLAQRIEGVRTFAGQTVTVSFWAKAGSGTPKVAVELQQDFGTGGSPSTAVNSYGGQITLSTSWVRYSVNVSVASISGKTIGTSNDFLGLYLWVSAGSDFNSRTGSLGLQNATFDFWGVQLEQNYQPTPFEQRPIGVELQLCQRYCQVLGTTSVEQGFGTTYFNSAVYIALVVYRLITQMRAAPSLTINTQGTCYNVNTATNYTTMTWYGGSSSAQTLYIYSSQAVGTANGQTLLVSGHNFILAAEL